MRIHAWRCAAVSAALWAMPALAEEHATPTAAPISPAAPRTAAPVLVERVEPVYPEAARLAGIGGVVSLQLEVGVDGSVGDVKVVRSAGLGLDAAAITAARQLKFKPALQDGQPIAATVLFDQRFIVRTHLASETTVDAPEATSPVPAEPAPAPEKPTTTTANGKPTRSYASTVVGRGPSSAASAETIRNLDFDLRPKTAPNDILRIVPGLLTVQHQGGGKADQLFLRGFDADHGTDVGIFVDGIPVNMPSHAHGQGYADLHWMIPEALDSIEVVKHPYDVRFGDFSTAGAVNLITRKDFPESFAQLMVGGFPTLGCSGGAAQCKLVAQERVLIVVAPKLKGLGLATASVDRGRPRARSRSFRRRREPRSLQYLRQAHLRFIVERRNRHVLSGLWIAMDRLRADPRARRRRRTDLAVRLRRSVGRRDDAAANVHTVLQTPHGRQ